MTFDIERSEIIFLPTPSHGGRQQRPQRTCQSRRDFYPRPHMEGDATRSDVKAKTAPAFLPTPSHGGRLVEAYLGVPVDIISTHALTWRATTVYPGQYRL